MPTYRTLNHVRERLSIARDIVKDPAVIAALDESIAELDQMIQDVLEIAPKPLVMPERFDFDAFLLDLMLPRNQMRVWDAAGIWS